VEFVRKDRYGMEDLLAIMRLLRGEGGCPWDREQTHASIRKNLIEETYETAEAIDMEDPDMLREELGDVLLQVVFHAQMEAEKGTFSFDDVVHGICEKLIVRHPHVFGSVRVDGTEQVLDNWNAIKQRTKGQTTASETLSSVPKQLPALMRAEKVWGRAQKANPCFGKDVPEALRELDGRLEALRAAPLKNGGGEEELGDLLFCAAGLARALKQDPEELLSRSTDRFIRRFSRAEALSLDEGKPFKEVSAAGVSALWEAAGEETGHSRG